MSKSSIVYPRTGEHLREWRLKSGLTQREVAKKSGVHHTSLSNFETGRRYPSLDTFAMLVMIYDVPKAEVWDVLFDLLTEDIV